MNTILKRNLLLFMIIICLTPLAYSQRAAIKTNLLYGATTTPNLGLEFKLAKRTSLDLMLGVNPFKLSDTKRFKHILFQPEVRYWLCEPFNGHFFGIHAHGAQFNIGGLDLPIGRLKNLKDKRYEGYLYGGGISYGYHWLLSSRWNLGFNIGAGYARVHYDKYPCAKCGSKLDDGKYNYWGVTKAALSLIYVIK